MEWISSPARHKKMHEERWFPYPLDTSVWSSKRNQMLNWRIFIQIRNVSILVSRGRSYKQIFIWKMGALMTKELVQNCGPLADDMEQTWKLQNIQVVLVVISATRLVLQNVHKAPKILYLMAGLYIQMKKPAFSQNCSPKVRFVSTFFNL